MLGAICLDQGKKQRLYVLVRRDPPAPPWICVTPALLQRSGWRGDLRTLEASLNARIGQAGYRQSPGHGARLTPPELFEHVMARTPLVGALEIQRAGGPQRLISRIMNGVAGAMVGGATGAVLTTIIFDGPSWTPAVAVVTALGGAAITQRQRRHRIRKSHARVLVLTPDGCVVGFPEGPRAFAWTALGPFRIGESDPKRRPHSNDGLRVVDAQGRALGHIDRAWFRGRLELIVAVANAYRTRVA